jgi:hypothetical protein
VKKIIFAAALLVAVSGVAAKAAIPFAWVQGMYSLGLVDGKECAKLLVTWNSDFTRSQRERATAGEISQWQTSQALLEFVCQGTKFPYTSPPVR